MIEQPDPRYPGKNIPDPFAKRECEACGHKAKPFDQSFREWQCESCWHWNLFDYGQLEESQMKLRRYCVTVMATAVGQAAYYPVIGQWLSFSGGLLVVTANVIWLAMIAHYLKHPRST